MCLIDVVVPVYNEQARAQPRRSAACTTTCAPVPVLRGASSIADNASTDATPRDRAPRWPRDLPGVDCCELDAKGPRPRAARRLVGAARRDVVCYMDVDLSTDLRALLPLVAPLVSGHSDVAIGTRLARGARVVRGRQARAHLARLQPACCTRRCARASPTPSAASRPCAPTPRARLLPDVRDDGWFFDTELLVLAQRARPAHPRGAGRLGRRPRLARGHRRAPRSTDLRGVARLLPPRAGRRASWPSASCSTLAYALLFLAAARPARRRRGANALALARHRGRPTRGQPAPHVRRARAARGLAAPARAWAPSSTCSRSA